MCICQTDCRLCLQRQSEMDAGSIQDIFNEILIVWQRVVPEMHYSEKCALPRCPQAGSWESLCRLWRIKCSELWMFSECWCVSSADSRGKARMPRCYWETEEEEHGDNCEHHLWVYRAAYPALHQAALIPTGEGQRACWGGLGAPSGVSVSMSSLEKPNQWEAWCFCKLQRPVHLRLKILNLNLHLFEM